jgi:hypothetical protein
MSRESSACGWGEVRGAALMVRARPARVAGPGEGGTDSKWRPESAALSPAAI